MEKADDVLLKYEKKNEQNKFKEALEQSYSKHDQIDM